jgi:hypothetical protein
MSADVPPSHSIGVVSFTLGNIWWEMFKHLGGQYHKPTYVVCKLLAMLKLASHQMGVTCPLNQLTVGMIRSAEKAAPKLKVKAQGLVSIPPGPRSEQMVNGNSGKMGTVGEK